MTQQITYEQFDEILNGESDGLATNGCDILSGLNLIAKYLPNSGIGAACHDQVFACGAEELVDAGITAADAEALRNRNWFIDEESLSHFA